MKDRIDLLVVGGLLVIDHIAVLDELPAPGGATLFPGLTRIAVKHILRRQQCQFGSRGGCAGIARRTGLFHR